jgi:hypothetical protein
MCIFAAVTQLERSFPKRARTVLFDHQQKFAESAGQASWKRPRKGLRVCGGANRPSARSFERPPDERSAKFPVEISLKTHNGHIEAQDFRRKAVLGAEFLRPCNPPLPFVPRHALIRHGGIISPLLPSRNAGIILGDKAAHKPGTFSIVTLTSSIGSKGSSGQQTIR